MKGHTPRRPQHCQAGAVLLACLAACGEPEDETFHYVTEKAEVTHATALCAGDLAHIDSTLLRIEEDLDAPSDDRVRVHIANEIPVPGCRQGALGCFRPDGIRTLWQSLDHELVHAVAVRLSDSLAPFWSEGLAETFNGERTQRDETGVLENLDLDPGKLSYFTAGHFVRWLLETRGLAAMRRIARGDSFEDVYGLPIEDAATEYEADAPWSYPPFVPCDYPALDVDGVGIVAEEIEISCDLEDSTAFGFWYGTGVGRRLDLVQDGTYELRLVGGAGVSFCACQTEILDAPPADDFVGDVIGETVGPKVATAFASEETHLLDLRAGSYRVLPMLDYEADDETVRFELRRIGD